MTPKSRVVLWVLLALVALAGLTAWEFASAPGELSWRSPLGQTVFWRLRLPRLLLAMAAGGLLSVAGAGFQTIFRNPLAEPYTLGVASGAALGAVLAIQLGAAVVGGIPAIALAAFAGALGVTSLLLSFAGRRSQIGGSSAATILLAGVVISLTCSALILLLQALADYTQTFRMVRWMMGGLATVDYQSVLWLSYWSLVVLGVAVRFHLQFDLLLTGEEFAQGRGLNVARFRRWALVTASLAIGAAVAVVGPIGFVGLVVPHIGRSLVGTRHRQLLPVVWLLGAVLLAFADFGARKILSPAELPVGVMTSLLGAPVFLWILLRRGLRSG